MIQMKLLLIVVVIVIIMNVYSFKTISMPMIRRSFIKTSINHNLYMSTTANDNKLISRLKVKKILEASDR